MIDPALYLAFVAAVAVLAVIPGPNVALIVAHSLSHGPKYGLLTVLGTSSAMVLQLGVTAAGMASLLSTMADWFEWLRWAGVAYLVFLGFRAWSAPTPSVLDLPADVCSPVRIYLRGLLVSLANPKTLVFYAAFLPQFITPGPSAMAQMTLLSVTFLLIASGLDSAWALLAGKLRGFLRSNARLNNRLTGGLLMAAGLGLAIARRP